jgi:hypothetical protein
MDPRRKLDPEHRPSSNTATETKAITAPHRFHTEMCLKYSDFVTTINLGPNANRETRLGNLPACSKFFLRFASFLHILYYMDWPELTNEAYKGIAYPNEIEMDDLDDSVFDASPEVSNTATLAQTKSDNFIKTVIAILIIAAVLCIVTGNFLAAFIILAIPLVSAILYNSYIVVCSTVSCI